MPRAPRPHIVKRTFAHLRGPRWVVDLGKIEGADGKRKRAVKTFKTAQAAETFLETQKGKIKRHGHAALDLTEDERISFQAARDRLARAGATINQAVEFFLLKKKPVVEESTLAKLIERCLLAKKLAGKRPRYLTQLKSSCTLFAAGREERLATSITREDVKAWILGNGYAPETQRTYLGDVRTLFSWAKEEKLVASNPIAGDEGWIELSALEDREITALTVEECRRLLEVALFGKYSALDRKTGARSDVPFWPLLGYLAIAMFAGVRPAEARRCTIAHLDLGERALRVTGQISKTRKTRVIELPRTAVIWLKLWRRLCPDLDRFSVKNFDRKWKALRRQANSGAWPHDALRHTAASYHFAAYQKLAALQAMFGHDEDEDTLFKHYRAVTAGGRMITRRMGEEFWKLTPRVVRLARADFRTAVRKD